MYNILLQYKCKINFADLPPTRKSKRIKELQDKSSKEKSNVSAIEIYFSNTLKLVKGISSIQFFK